MKVKFFTLGAVGLLLLALTSCNSNEKTLAATRQNSLIKRVSIQVSIPATISSCMPMAPG
jgi:uncharacterized protein YcfL